MALNIVFHPVGAGHSVHVVTPDGRFVVIDAGASDGQSPLSWLRGITDRIDQLIISHPHGDHIQELDQLRQFKSVGVFTRPRGLDEATVRAANQSRYKEQLDVYFELDRRYQAPIRTATTSGQPAVAIESFVNAGTAPSNLNNHSVVVSVRYAGWEFLIPGDNEASSWRALSSDPRFASLLQSCDVFLASHHGRDSGYCDATFPALLTPQLCIVSDGCVRDTDASAKYGARATGLKVIRPDGNIERRFCITTRDNGLIRARVEQQPDGRGHLTIEVARG